MKLIPTTLRYEEKKYMSMKATTFAFPRMIW